MNQRMEPVDLTTVAAWTGGMLQGTGDVRAVDAAVIDSRRARAGALFFALPGSQVDGHRFVAEVWQKGALPVVAASQLGELSGAGQMLVVGDPERALRDVARGVRERLPARAVVITGSSGKTTTKDLIAHVLQSRDCVTKTAGNYNNLLGLPLSICEADSSHQWAIWEIGMNHPGEIEALADLAQPDIAVVTNVGTAHIEFLGSREVIAREKGMLLEKLSGKGVAVLSAEDDFTAQLRQRTAGRVVTCGIECGDVSARGLHWTESGMEFDLVWAGQSERVVFPQQGEHMVRNALQAAAVALVGDFSLEQIASALHSAVVTGGRFQKRELHGWTVIDDTYNANPESVEAALQTLGRMPTSGERWAVLGVMAELGEQSEGAHRRVGQVAARAGIDRVLTLGEETEALCQGAREAGCERVERFATREELAEQLRRDLKPGDVVLFKGSRRAQMEKVIELLG